MLVLVELVADALVVDPAELLVLGPLGGLDEALEEPSISSIVRVWVSSGTSSLSFLLTL